MPVFQDPLIDPKSLETYMALSDGRTGDVVVERPSDDQLKGHPPLIVGGPYALVYYVLEAAGMAQEHTTLARWFGLETATGERTTTHYLRFPHEPDAREVAQKLSDFGPVQVEQLAESWIVQVQTRGVSQRDLEQSEARLEAAARELGGDYDGRDVPV
jgi:hypothetical protein